VRAAPGGEASSGSADNGVATARLVIPTRRRRPMLCQRRAEPRKGIVSDLAPRRSRQWAQRGDPRTTFWAGAPGPTSRAGRRPVVRVPYGGEDESNGCAFRSGSQQGPVITGGGGRADPHPEERGAADRDGRRGVAGFDLTVDAERGRDQDRVTGGGAATCSAPMSMPTTPFLAGGRPGGRCRARPPDTSPGPRVASVRQAQTTAERTEPMSSAHRHLRLSGEPRGVRRSPFRCSGPSGSPEPLRERACCPQRPPTTPTDR
jgi:hypothetical protein